MTVRAVFDFDPAEHYQVSRVVARQTAARWIPWVFVAVALALGAMPLLEGWGEAEPFALFMNVLPWLLLAAFWLWLFPFLQWRAARKLPQQDPSVRGSQERIVDESGFHSRGNSVALDVPWHAMVRGVETEQHFLFWYNKQYAYYLPKRALSAEQTREVRTLMATGLGDRAQLLGT